MKAEMMVRALPKDVTKVYLINQDYLFGQSVQREVKNYLAKLRPDVQVVGDELIPLGKVKDFSPYITKIKASGAQALLTGNWGPDMNLLIKAGVDAGARPALLHLLCPSGRRPDRDRRRRRQPRAVGDVVRRERGAGDRQQGGRGVRPRRSATSTSSTSPRPASAPSSSICRPP